MSKKKLLALSDADGEVHFFDREDLRVQLVEAGEITSTGAEMSAARTLAAAVAKMRKHQTIYFQRRDPTDLELAKDWAARVDKLLPVFSQTLDKLEAYEK